MIFRRRQATNAHAAWQELSSREPHVRDWTRPRAHPTSILVAVDGSAGSVAALEWAIVRAMAGRNSLQIVHVFRWPAHDRAYGVSLAWEPPPLEMAEELVTNAAYYAWTLAPTLQIRTVVRAGGPAAGILDTGKSAELIVLGGGPRHTGLMRLIPTITAQVARGARGRVVVVGPDEEELL